MGTWSEIERIAVFASGDPKTGEVLNSSALACLAGEALDLLESAIAALETSSKRRPLDIREKASRDLAAWVLDKLGPSSELTLRGKLVPGAVLLDSALLGLHYQIYFRMQPGERDKWIAGQNVDVRAMRDALASYEGAAGQLRWLRTLTYPDRPQEDEVTSESYGPVRRELSLSDNCWSAVIIACEQLAVLRQTFPQVFEEEALKARYASVDGRFKEHLEIADWE